MLSGHWIHRATTCSNTATTADANASLDIGTLPTKFANSCQTVKIFEHGEIRTWRRVKLIRVKLMWCGFNSMALLMLSI